MIVTLLFTSIYAQAQGLKGSVKDSKTGQGIPGVSISVQGRTTGTVSDGNGNYVLKLQAGTYTIKVSAVGYQVVTESVQIDANGTSKNFSLVESISSLEEVVVTVHVAKVVLKSTHQCL
jgi:iron complex outermembrane receptor protein